MKKRSETVERPVKNNDQDSLEFYKDKDIKSFRDVVKRLVSRYKVTTTDILNASQNDVLIPCTIFSRKLSPLETVAKYLSENQGLRYTEIGELLGRNEKSVWQAHKNANKKVSGILKVKETQCNVPVSELDTGLSLLEGIVVWLKKTHSFREIAEILHRDERTIWTVYARARKKNA